MNIEFSLFKVVKSWPGRCQDVVRFKANDIMKKSAELINLALYLDIRPRVLLEEAIVLKYLVLKLTQLGSIVLNHLLLTKNIKELALAQILPHLLYHGFD